MAPNQSWTNHAYLILAHDNLPTLNALIDALSETGTIYIHLDKKSRINPQHITHAPHIHIYQKYRVYWGGWSIIQATQFLADEALKNHAYRLTLLSGVSYPLVSRVQLLKLGNSENDIFHAEEFNENIHPQQFKFRFTHRHLPVPISNNLKGRVIRRLARETSRILPKLKYRKYLLATPLMVGPQWWSVTSTTYLRCKKIYFLDQNYVSYFKMIECPDESFFVTGFIKVTTNHLNQSTTYIEWLDRGIPRKFNLIELKKISTTEQNLFIRKVIF